MPTPQELARVKSDNRLEACGWIVQSRVAMNLYKMHEVVVRELLS